MYKIKSLDEYNFTNIGNINVNKPKLKFLI